MNKMQTNGVQSNKVLIKAMIIVLMLLFLTGQTRPAAAAPPLQGGNLLQNPGFEAPYNPDGAAGNWVRWHRESSADQFGDCLNGYHKRPQWGNAIDFVHSGASSQYVGNNWDTWAGGVWQTVSVTPGSTYRFSFWARGRASMEGSGPSYGYINMNVQALIDPDGSGLWNDADVIWGLSGSPHDQWQQFSLEATATGDKMTVFTAADFGVPGVNQCLKFLATYFDSAELVEVGPPPSATPPPPPPPPPQPVATATPVPPTATFTPAVTPTNTPIPTNTPSPTPAGAIVCVNAFADENANGLHDATEGYMAGVTFTVASATEVVGQAVSPGKEETVCFEGLASGDYQVAQIVPGRLEMTTAANTTLAVEVGNTYGVEFGSRIRPADSGDTGEAVASNTEPGDAAGEQTAGDDDGAGLNWLAISGLVVMLLAVVLLGVLIFLVLRRQA